MVWWQELVRLGAEANAQASNGQTALQAAAIAGNEETLRALVRLGAHLTSRDNEGLTALHSAAAYAQV